MCFWDFKIGELINSVIALANIVFAVYLFGYKRNKDTRDKIDLVGQMKQTAKIEWFKLLIIEPNVQTIHKFFLDVEKITELITLPPPNRSDYRIEYSSEIGRIFNKFDKEVLSLIESVDSNLHREIEDVIDNLSDYLTARISDMSEFQEFDKKKIIRSAFITSKNDFFKKLYKFTP